MENILNETESYVSKLLNSELDHQFVYHNLTHTQRVVSATEELITGEKISDKDANILRFAAWFHDSGYTQGKENHEAIGAKIAEKFLSKQKLDDAFISEVQRLILATKMGHEPTDVLEKIIRDADSWHFQYKKYNRVSELLRLEWEQLDYKEYTEVEWLEENISFFTKHHRYYTKYALENWQSGKDKNLASLFQDLKKQEKAVKKAKKKTVALELKKRKARLPERGVETMFRVTLKNHISLSNIADTKANILLSVNAIIVSLALSNLLPKLDNSSNKHLIIPTVIFVVFTVISMVMSILATRPNVTRGEFTKEDVKNKKVNLLFFGNFHRMALNDFEWAMNEMMQDREYLYGSMTKDLYFLGLVLDKKYRILRRTYTVFMVGIIISVIAFAVSFAIQEVEAAKNVNVLLTQLFLY
jgi:predicted metal-dependent HD superfamily phosphohydrolase